MIMRYRDCSRRELIEVLQPSETSSRNISFGFGSGYSSALPTPSSELQLIWGDEGGDEPVWPLIVVNEGSARELLAWTATYFPHQRPLTAFTRILDRPLAEAALTMHKPHLGKLADACAGVVLAEVISRTSSRSEILAIPLQTYQATFSFSLMRLLALNGANAVRMFESSWRELDTILRGRRLQDRRVGFSAVWSALRKLSTQEVDNTDQDELPPEFSALLSELLREGELGYYLISRIANEMPVVLAARQMQGPREERVSIFNSAIRELLIDDRGNDVTRAFVAGMLASFVGPGSLDYFELLRPLEQKLPGCTGWYGLFSGMQRGSAVQTFGNGIGKRIVRDALQPQDLFAAPTCDIAIDELAVLARSKALLSEIRTLNTGWAQIELFPCVTTYRHLLDEGISSQQDLPQLISRADVDNIGEELWTVANRLMRLQERVSGLGRVEGKRTVPRRRNST